MARLLSDGSRSEQKWRRSRQFLRVVVKSFVFQNILYTHLYEPCTTTSLEIWHMTAHTIKVFALQNCPFNFVSSLHTDANFLNADFKNVYSSTLIQ